MTSPFPAPEEKGARQTFYYSSTTGFVVGCRTFSAVGELLSEQGDCSGGITEFKPVVAPMGPEDEEGMYLFHCPGCRCGHWINTKAGAGKPVWQFNGDLLKPTVTPSILVKGTVPITDAEAARIMAGEKITPVPLVCHSYVTEGNIRYLSDSTHHLSGQTVPLPPVFD